MLSLQKLLVALGSLLALAVSSLLWRLAAHRRRFKNLVSPMPAHASPLPC
jgi:hypothetical protein